MGETNVLFTSNTIQLLSWPTLCGESGALKIRTLEKEKKKKKIFLTAFNCQFLTTSKKLSAVMSQFYFIGLNELCCKLALFYINHRRYFLKLK